MKRTLLCLILLLCLTCVGCTASPEATCARLLRSIGNELNIDLSQAEILSLHDTHGGFHGDGLLAVCLRPDAQTAAHLSENLPTRYWLSLPITGNARRMLFEGPDALASGALFENIGEHPSGRALGDSPEGGFPDSSKGCWLFRDKQLGMQDPNVYTASHIFDDERASKNFWCAWFDAETGLMYFIEFDT